MTGTETEIAAAAALDEIGAAAVDEISDEAADLRTRFAVAMNRLEEIRAAAPARGHPLNAEFRAVVVAAYREHCPKPHRGARKAAAEYGPDFNCIVGALGDRYAPIREDFQGRALAATNAHEAELEAATKAAVAAAAAAPIVTATGCWRRLDAMTSSASDYRSTCSGEKYAKCHAELGAAGLRAGLGLVARVVREAREPTLRGYGDSRDPFVSFHVEAEFATNLDIEIVMRRNERLLPLREWVRGCWARGCQPRVFSPHLPHGYEEQNRLDFFGGETAPRAAAAEPQR